MSLQDFRAGYGLRTAHGIEEDQGRHDDHVRGEGSLHDALPEALPHAHPWPGPDYGAHDQRREAGEPVETGRDVAGGAHDADEERHDQAGGDGGLGVQPEAEDQQGYRQNRVSEKYWLTATPIRDDGATVEEKSAAALQLTGASLRMFRSVPESALKMMMTRLAATASLMLHPAA